MIRAIERWAAALDGQVGSVELRIDFGAEHDDIRVRGRARQGDW